MAGTMASEGVFERRQMAGDLSALEADAGPLGSVYAHVGA